VSIETMKIFADQYPVSALSRAGGTNNAVQQGRHV
jgi:hypothetical protein